MAIQMFVSILWIQVVAFSIQVKGLELNLNRELLLLDSREVCGQVTCVTKGRHQTIETATLSRVAEKGHTTHLLTVTSDDPLNDTVHDSLQLFGTLKNNVATVRATLLKASDCHSIDSYICHVTYVDKSGKRGETFTMTGPVEHSTLLPDIDGPPPHKKPGLSPAAGAADVPERSSRLVLQELEFLSRKLDRMEEKSVSAEDRLERRVESRVRELRDRVLTVETGLTARVASLEDRFSSRSPGSGQTSPGNSDLGVARALADLERRVGQLAARQDAVNTSLTPGDTGVQQPAVCERGMGDDVTKTFPRYVIMENDVIEKQILCDTQTNGGGWIVIQRRARGDVDFYRDWSSYRDGFGSPTGDFWMGNEAIHQLTDSEAYELRVDIRFEGRELFAEYAHFRIEAETDKYRLRVGEFSGTADEALIHANNQEFSTFDADHDTDPASNCSILAHGAWWYKACYAANLNGKWAVPEPEGNVWNWVKGKKPVSFSEMKIRRVKAPM